MGVRDDYKEAKLGENKEQFTMLALLGFVGIGGVHRFLIALRAKDEQQAFMGGIYLLPLILVGLLVFLGDGFKLWYLLPLIVTYALTIHDLTSMDRLLSGELSAKKAWYETWPGRVGAVILLPVALYFLYNKTDLPKKQKNTIACALIGGLALLLGASFTGVEELAGTDETPLTSQEDSAEEPGQESEGASDAVDQDDIAEAQAGDDEGAEATGRERITATEAGLPETCTAAREAGIETPIYADDDNYAAWLDRDKDGIACE